MPRQISDEEYAYLQNRRSTADFADSLFNDPNTNKDVKAIIKKKYPNLAIPDYDIEQKVEQRFQERDKKEQEEREKQQQQREQQEFETKRSETQKRYGLTDDAMERMERMMVERNIGDYDAAATFFASREPKTSDPGYDPTRWHHDKQESFNEIAKDPEAWGRDQILKAIYRDEANAKNR